MFAPWGLSKKWYM